MDPDRDAVAPSGSTPAERAGVAIDEARDVLWLCSAPELYEVLVAARGWTGERLGAFASTTMAAALLDG